MGRGAWAVGRCEACLLIELEHSLTRVCLFNFNFKCDRKLI